MTIERIKYENDLDREAIINENSNLFLIKEECHLDGNFLTFTDVKPLEKPLIDEVVKEQGEKISILEAENADLLLDSAIKDSKIQTLENDLADLTLEIAMMEVR